MSDIMGSVVASIIAAPITFFLALTAKTTWSVIRNFDRRISDELSKNVAFRTYASAKSVSSTVLGCTAILTGFIWMLFVVALGFVDLQGSYWELNHSAHQMLAKGLLADASGDPIQLPNTAIGDDFYSSAALYFGLAISAFGFINLFLGLRLLTHLSTATTK